MIVFPCAKINLGLNIVGELENGYHSLETVFYPIPIYDALEIKYMDEKFPGEAPCDLKVTGNQVDCDEQSNLVIKAYHVLAEDFSLPRVHAHLYKQIPSKAGLGGGSSDGAFMIRLLDERFRLNIGNPEMERYAAKLGAVRSLLPQNPVSGQVWEISWNRLMVREEIFRVIIWLLSSRIFLSVPQTLSVK